MTDVNAWQSVLSKILTGAVILGVIVGGISWWTMSAETRALTLDFVGRTATWAGCVGLLPWLLFFAIGKVAKLDSNLAGAIFVFCLTAAELVGLAWLFDWSIHGSRGWTVYVFAALLAGLYNLLASDWIAEKVA